MIRTTTYLAAAVVLLIATTAASPVAAKDFLSIVANAPAVPLEPRRPGRNFVQLPALEYLFEIYAQCADNRSPESLSLNIADTRKSLQADNIANVGPTEISLTIPANQIAPLVVEDFCIAVPEENDGGPDGTTVQLDIPAALSAQASLLCVGAEDKAMTYISKTLDVSLVCDRQAEDIETADE